METKLAHLRKDTQYSRHVYSSLCQCPVPAPGLCNHCTGEWEQSHGRWHLRLLRAHFLGDISSLVWPLLLAPSLLRQLQSPTNPFPPGTWADVFWPQGLGAW